MKNSKTNKLLSVLLAVLMVVTMFPVTVFAAESYTWTKVDFADITANDTVMITMTNPHGVTYALPSNYAQKNPADVVTVEGNSIVTASADYGWKISAVDGGYTISSTTGYLNSINDNNGVRVNTTHGVWNLDGNYLRTSDGTNDRWLGVYDNNNGDYSVTANWRAYKNTTGNTKNQTIGFWKLGEGSSAPVEPEETEAIIADGDYVIWAPKYGKALSTGKVSTYYNAGIDVTLSGEKLTGYGESEIWTVTNNDDGTITIANGGQKLSMAASNKSMTMDAVNDKWEVIALGDGLYNVKNVGRGNFMEWYAQYSNWSTYNSSSAATDGQFQLAFYAISKEPEAPAVKEVTAAEFLAAAEDDTLYSVTGKITEVTNPTYRNFHFEDSTGSVFVYGNKDLPEVEVGDTVKVTGKRSSYNGDPQMSGIVSVEIIEKAPEAIIADGDYVIWAPKYGKALSATKTGNYNVGVDVALSGEKLSGYGETEIWTVTNNDDGTVTIANGGRNIGMANEYSSMNLGAVNDKWEVIALGDGLYNVKNVGRGNFMEWYAQYSNWSTYNSSNAATDGQFQLAFYPAEAEPEVQYAEKLTELPGKGDVIVIYNSGNAMASYANGKKIAAIPAELAEGKLPLAEGMANLVVDIQGDNYIFTLDGKYLTSAPTGNGMSFEEELTDCGKWTIEEGPDNTWYIKNAGANYNGNYNQAMEYYSGFTTYGIKETEIYQMQIFLAEEGKEIPDGDYVIWAPEYGKALSTEKTGYYNVGVDVTLSGEKLTGYGETEIWTVTNNEDGTITIANGGQKLSMAASNSSMTMDEVNDKWEVIALGDGLYNVKNVGRGNFIEWYAKYNNWSTYNASYAATDGQFQLMFTPAEEVEDTSVLPAEGDEVVIYNLSAKGVLAEENDQQSIENVSAEIVEEKAVPENGAVVFTVSKNGEYFRFHNETYGYLCSNGTGNNAFYTPEASDDADWTLEELGGGYRMLSRVAKYNGSGKQYLEYYADSYKTYSFYATNKDGSLADTTIYEFYFYPVAEGTKLTGGIVNMPKVDFGTVYDANVGSDYTFDFVVDAVFGVEGELVVTANGETLAANDDGTYTLSAEKVIGEKFTITVTGKDTKGVEINGSVEVAVKDEPSVGAIAPSANSQTGDEKRPVISAEIINAGENATITMTVNGEKVEAVYENGKITYTPAEDLADGRTSVVVTVVRADGKETSKAWNFIVGEAQYQLYFGQLHSHTTYSDGSGSLESALDYIASLPDSANVDFVAFTDHSNYFDTTSSANPEGALYDMSLASESSRNLWNEYKGTIADFNASQSDVIALGGFEMTWSGGPGHINTFNTPGIVSRNNSTLNNKTADAGMKAYYALLSQAEGADSLSQFNHPGSTFGTFTDFAYWDAVVDTRIQMVEVGNGEGQIGAGGYYPSYEYYVMALDKGWHVAPTNNQDNHKGKWGNGNDARDVVITDDFTEQGIYNAIRDMRMYATEDKNLEINYTLNGQLLGSTIEEVPEKLNINVSVYDPDKSDSISKVEVVVNSGKTAYTWDDPAALAAGNFMVELDPTYSYYFIRVTEGDGDLAVTAPVWVGESLKLGISSFVSGTSTPVTGEELTLTTTLFNSEKTEATVKSLTYAVKGGEVIGTDNTGYAVPASGTVAVDFAYTPDSAKVMTITVTAVVELEGEEYTFSMDIELDVQDAEKLVYIGIDASHYNEYVNGNYKDSMGNFGQLAAEYSVRTVTLYESEDLIAACRNPKYKALILTAPSRRLAAAQSDPKVYTEAELEAIKEFNANGGIVIIAGWSDNYENYDVIQNNPAIKHMAETQNDVLKALGSSIRMGDDATYDDVRSAADGVDKWRLYFNTYGDSFLTEGVEVDPEHPYDRLYTEVFSHYGGATIFTEDGTLPETVTPVVFGHATTYSVDVDKDGLGGDGTPKYEYAEGDNRLMVMAAEQLEGRGLIIVSGAAFMSNFEVQATIEDSGSEKNYSNYKICENLLAYINPVVVSDIADVQAEAEEGVKFTVEGIVTSNASGYDKNTAFFDCIYVQDETAGINAFPVAGNFKIGDKVRISGTTSSYNGERQLNVASIEKIGEETPVEAKEVSAREVNNGSVLGSLITLKGTVTKVVKENGLVQTIMVKDAKGDTARVFIDGYITTDEDVQNIRVGSTVVVTGLASYDNSFAGIAPRIRIRDRADVVCTGYSEPSFEVNKPEGGIVIDLTKGEDEANPETGAPVRSGVSAIAGIAVLSAAAFVIGKRK